MGTVIFRTIAPFLSALMVLFSLFVLLRGHDEPGGGFIGGLIAASGLAIYGIAFGVDTVRRAVRFNPNAVAGAGLVIAGLAGLLSLPSADTFLTGLWYEGTILGVELKLSTPLVFDIGVYLVVVGSIGAIALSLEEAD